MIGWFRKNWRSLLWALLLSVAVWIAAVTAADPDDQRIYGKPVSIEIVGQDSGLVIVGEIPSQVEVTLRAPRSVWDRIDGQEKPIRAVVDLSGLSAGDHSVRVQVQVSENPARVVSVSPASFTVTLEPLASRVFTVGLTLNGQPATGYQAGNPSLDPLEVLVSGAESLVGQVDRARIAVNLTGTRESVNQTVDVQLLDKNNRVLRGLSVNPASVLVNIPVAQQGGYRDVAVKVIVQGQVANGYLLTNLSVFPPIVTVFSTDPTLVNELPGIVQTQPLELRGASEDISTRLALELPEGISVVGEQSVQVQVGIEPIISNLTLSNVKIEVVGLGDGLAAQVSPIEVDVILSGPAPLLDSLLVQDIRVTVDVTNFGAGVYQLTPQVEILISNIDVESVLPNTVEVVIAPAPTPTP
ncbi:MAG: YbbR-like domain-containing protein [Chloroflexota bacterium]